MGVAAELDPQILEADLAPVALGPEEVGVALVHRDDVLVVDLGTDPLLLAPDARAVGPLVAVGAVLEERAPLGARQRAQRIEIVGDLQERTIAGGIDHLVERVALVGVRHRGEPGARVGHYATPSQRRAARI